jgi:hypothetical protein
MRNIHALGSLRVFWATMSAGIDKSRRVQNELFLLYHDFSLLLECGHVAKVEIRRGPLKEGECMAQHEWQRAWVRLADFDSAWLN